MTDATSLPLLRALETGDTTGALALLVVALVWGARRALSQRVPVLRHDAAGVLLAIGVSALVVGAWSVLSGEPLSRATLTGAVRVALGAMGAHAVGRKLLVPTARGAMRKGGGAAAMVLAMLSSGCAPGLAGVQQSITATERVATATMTAFGEFDAERQRSLVEAAATADAAREALRSYRSARACVLSAFAAVDAAIMVARTGVSVAQAGGKVDMAALVSDVATSALEVQRAVNAVRAGGSPCK